MEFLSFKKFYLFLIYIFIQIFEIIYCKAYRVNSVDPPHLKISDISEGKNISYLTLMFNESISYDNKDKENKIIKLENSENPSQFIDCQAAEEELQDEFYPNKVIFILQQELFWNKSRNFGKYSLTKMRNKNETSWKDINYDDTILIYLNKLALKNPVDKYELTSNVNEKIKIQYQFKSEVLKEYINRIGVAYDNSDDIKEYLTFFEVEKTYLIITFNRSKLQQKITFFIFPEYNKEISPSETQKFYLYFQHFILLNDAIYIERNNDNNLVYFKAKFMNEEVIERFLISESGNNYECNRNLFSCNNVICTCFFEIGKKSEPGKLIIHYNSQSYSSTSQPIFLILYDNLMEKCYPKDSPEDLSIKTYWIKEMEYDHYIFFNDSAPKDTISFEISTSYETLIYLYKTKISSLSSGTITLYSMIPELSNSNGVNLNPIDDKSLNVTIYPGKNIIEKNVSYIFTHNNTEQIVIFNSNSARSFDTIILKKSDYEFRVSKSNNQCNLGSDNITFICNFSNIIDDFDENYLGNYSVYFKSLCDETEYMILERYIIIKKGYSLLSISPQWFFINNIIGKTINLQYGNKMEENNLKISIYKDKEKNKIIANFSEFEINNENVEFNLLEELGTGLYHIKTEVDNIVFYNDNIGFRVIEQNNNFVFSHNYFVLNNKAEKNYLIISVNDTKNTFGCMIEEEFGKQNLTHYEDNCTTFYYNINRTGIINFNYYHNDSNTFLLVPINGNITVVSYSSNLFDIFSFKNCYYYKFDIFIKYYNSIPKYLVFLYEKNKTINLNYSYDGEYMKYFFENKSDYSYTDLIKKEFNLFVSEDHIDTEIYLYKTENSIKFTDIGTPEFIIKPNLKIMFNNITCNLSDSRLEIKKNNSNEISRQLGNCIYEFDKSLLFCDIKYNHFYTNNYYTYYRYLIENKEITDINDKSKYSLTFASNRLNDSSFNIIYSKHDMRKISVTITNINKDFYLSLIKESEYSLITNGNNETKIVNKSLMTIDDKKGSIQYYVDIRNFVLHINYLKRDYNDSEGDVGDSIYHYFKISENNTYRFSLFIIEPIIFAYYNFSKENQTFKVNITFDSNETLLEYNSSLQNLIPKKAINDTTLECLIDFNNNNFLKDQKQIFFIKIGNISEKIEFIYISLEEDSKSCKTKNNQMNDLTLFIDIPNPLYMDLIDLVSESWINFEGPFISEILDYRLIYKLNGKDINLKESIFSIYIIGFPEFKKTFSLQELGINIFPAYEIRLSNNENKISLLPEKNQNIILYVFIQEEVEENLKNLSNINSFGIEDFSYSINKTNISENSLYLKIDLDWVKDKQKEFQLYYRDKCNERINTSIIISVTSFDVKRNYFVLNNNMDMPSQRVVFNGPHGGNIKINVYKDNSSLIPTNYNYSGNYYYFDLYQNSIGNYTFKLDNNGKETPINSNKIYVVNYLEELLNYSRIPSCVFLNEDKSSLEDLSFSILSKDKRIEQISIFKSSFKINNNNFYYELEGNIPNNNNNNKIFSFKSQTLKNIISTNTELHLYLMEGDDKEQPLYVFKMNYTNIELHSSFSEFIYTDTKYILFQMNCEIDEMDSFYLSSQNMEIENKFSCEKNKNEIFFDKIKRSYECSLSKCNSNNNKNPMCRYDGKSITYYGKYFIKYSDKKYIINKNPFILSHAINDSDFILETDKRIYVDQYTNIKIKTPNKKFYMKNVEKLIYYNSKDKQEYEPNFNINDDTIEFSILIKESTNYTIKEIWRKECKWCWNEDYWKNNADNHIISSNTNIKFIFYRKYISLKNSTDSNNNSNTEIKILVNGSDKGNVEKIKYKFTSEIGVNDSGEMEKNEDIYYKNVTKAGKYEFKYTIKGDNNEYEINNIVLVSDYDYNIFNLSELYKNCFYYNLETKELYTSISKNISYKFIDLVDEKDLILKIENVDFNYTQNGFKIISNNNLNYNRNYSSFKLIEKIDIEKKYIFTNINHIFSLTNFNFENDFYYKDNIIILNLKCELNDIYIKKINSDESPSKLICQHNGSDSIFYCNAKTYVFTNSKKETFQFLIGNKRKEEILSTYFNITYKTKLIYNAIYNSNFRLEFRDSIVKINSDNFDMNFINYIKIDNETSLLSNFNNKTNDYISFKFEKSNNTLKKNYVTELIRFNHPFDIENITIKNKKVNLLIIEKECEEFTVNYLDSCISCKLLATFSGQDPNKIWYQNGQCVVTCNFSAGYGIYSELNNLCYKCVDSKTFMNNKNEYYCGCLEGTVKSIDDDFCYLPDRDEIKDQLIKNRNLQCFREDAKTKNYCNNNNTQVCVTYYTSGSPFPQCICKDGYDGKYCEFKSNAINLTKKMEEILSNDEQEIDEGNNTIISNIRGIKYFLDINEKEYINQIENYIDNYINSCIRNLKRILNGTKTEVYPQVFDMIELALYFLKYKIFKDTNKRNLNEEKNNLDFVLNNLHYVNFQGNRNMSREYYIQNGSIITFITYRKEIINSENFKQELKNISFNKIIEYIDIPTQTEEDLIFVTLINKAIFNKSSNNFDVKAYFSTNNSIQYNDLNNINIIYYVSSSNISFNFDLAQYYKERKIQIYNKKDLAFVDTCFLSKEFDFDLTQKYRKKNVYQKLYYGNNNCQFYSFEPNYNRLIFNCTQFNDIQKISHKEDLVYGLFIFNISNDTIDDDKEYNIHISCTRKIDNLKGNYAFWLFLIICIFEIIYIVGINILTLGSLKKVSFRKGLIHDELYYHIPRKENKLDDDFNSNDEQLAKSNIKKNKHNKFSFNQSENSSYINDNNNVDKFYKTLGECILLNFKELHPVATLCRVSIISPLVLNSWFFVFNSLILFGFNALLYFESLIEKRIYDKKRNNFDYPMRKEFHKIILSILCQIVITVLIKLVLIVRLKQRDDLKASLVHCTLKENEEINNEIIARIEQFQDNMLIRRLIGALLMLLGIVFFFYYSVVFCGIYIKTQLNWIYSGVWSLFWNWVIFSPIYIIIISFIEFKKSDSFDPLVYNLKRLFFF